MPAGKNGGFRDVKVDAVGFVPTPTKPAMHSNMKPATHSETKPATVPI